MLLSKNGAIAVLPLTRFTDNKIAYILFKAIPDKLMTIAPVTRECKEERRFRVGDFPAVSQQTLNENVVRRIEDQLAVENGGNLFDGIFIRH
jgi:hypothetical protein